ncbi:DoxX family protein [Maribacter stanieri]|uniref:DoxX family protein n=1 Tax=Maribacter stanieri TaxID=440514 RepID=UPI0024951DEA|nr:DoxX family protein [Maribacter stanieri]
METVKKTPKSLLWTSYILQGFVIIMLLMGAVNNVLQTETAVQGAVEMGYPSDYVMYLGIILLVSTVLYAMPKTMFIGALLVTAWLGGAVATHVIHKDHMTLTIFPVIFGILVWVSVLIRNKKLRALL